MVRDVLCPENLHSTIMVFSFVVERKTLQNAQPHHALLLVLIEKPDGPKNADEESTTEEGQPTSKVS